MKIEEAAKLIGTSTQDVFEKMLQTEVAPIGFFWDPHPPLTSEIMVATCLHGDLAGYMSLHCTECQGREFARRLLGLPQDELTADLTSPDTMRDAISEIMNMISGVFRSALSEDQWIEMALPLFFRAPILGLRVPGARGLVVHIDSPVGGFQVELTAIPKSKPEEPA